MSTELIPRRFHKTALEYKNLISKLEGNPSRRRNDRFHSVLSTWRASIAFARLRRQIDQTADGIDTPMTSVQFPTSNRRPTTEDFRRSGQKMSFDNNNADLVCIHLEDMSFAEEKITECGFCDFRCSRGLVPARFLPSLVTFRDRVLTSVKHNVNGQPRIHKLVTVPDETSGNSFQAAQTHLNKIDMCPHCGCYIWELRKP